MNSSLAYDPCTKSVPNKTILSIIGISLQKCGSVFVSGRAVLRHPVESDLHVCLSFVCIFCFTMLIDCCCSEFLLLFIDVKNVIFNSEQ